MAEVKVLVEGYAKELENGWSACSTSVLIKSGDNLIVFDPGCNREKLLGALKKEKLEPKDIDFVVLSHNHLDHSSLVGIFENAKIISSEGLIYDGDLMTEIEDNVLGESVSIIETPGHCSEHISLVVDTERGKCVLAGDVFWWSEGEEQVVNVDKEDDSHPAELNMDELKKSRRKLLELGDWIIPGHGGIVEVKK